MTCKPEKKKNELIDGDFCEFFEGLVLITIISACIECICSSFRMIWSKMHNRLGGDTKKKGELKKIGSCQALNI